MVACAFSQLFNHLRSKRSAQIRYMALLLCAELMSRSKHFRSLMADNFQDFIELTVGVSVKVATATITLPDPPKIAAMLKEKSLVRLKIHLPNCIMCNYYYYFLLLLTS